jgi:predicted dehydrogenase
MKLGFAGCGNWGKNLLRNFVGVKGVEVGIACDVSEKRLDFVRGAYPGMKVTKDFDEVLSSGVDAVAIATNPSTHRELAVRALKKGLHVFVEKPMAISVAEAEEMQEASKKAGRILMVGHVMLYNPAVEKLKALISAKEFGEIYYVYSQRVNLGTVRKDENAMWSIGPHDISMILHLLEEAPVSVSATGRSYLQKGVEDVVFMNLDFASGKLVNIQLSWLDPHKVRRLTVVGSRKMAVFDDVEPVEKIKIFDKGVGGEEFKDFSDYLTVRMGDILIPAVKMDEPLRRECGHFAECVKSGAQPKSNGEEGLRVIRVLEAAEKSIKAGGAPVGLPAKGGRV